MKYCATDLAIKIIRDAAPTDLYQRILHNAYQERRKPHFLFTYDGSHNKYGKKGFHNWINLPLKEVNFPWYNLRNPISNDKLRVELKKLQFIY